MKHGLSMSFAMVLFAAACGGGGGGKQAAAEPTDERPPTRVPIDDGEDDGGEDEPDDVQVEGLLGRLDAGQIQPVIEASWDQVQTCYSDGIGKKLRYVGGLVELKFRVNRDGTVKHVRVARGVLGHWGIEKCVLELARAMTFPKPKGGEAEFSFPIEFPPRGRAQAMDENRVSGEVAPKLAELAKCSDESEGPMPRRIDVTLYVGPGGAVTSAGFSSADEAPIPDAWGDCAFAAATSWKLTDPRGSVWKATATWEAP
jgi:TonB family protein